MNLFSQTLALFHDRPLPEPRMKLAGYAALIDQFKLRAPLPETLCAISEKHRKYTEGNWHVFTPRHAPDPTVFAHMVFALKYEGLDLHILDSLFDQIPPKKLAQAIQNEPTGIYSRKIWFLYEWLKQKPLLIPDLTMGNFSPLIDEEQQFAGPERVSKRHRIKNNLPGVQNFCPLIRKTEIIQKFLHLKLDEKVHRATLKIHPDILARAAAFLWLDDSKASYRIEGENPSPDRIRRWGQVIGQAGLKKLTKDELIRLQRIVISDTRFTHMGWRKEDGFIGSHDRESFSPLPEHISAKPQDLDALINGLIETNQLLNESLTPPVLQAAAISFGFVFIHPFEDGNGRIHRYLLHHILNERKFNPEGIIFPISTTILKEIKRYKNILESYSRPRLGLIDWHPTTKNNVQVLNETINLYRFFDATKQVEFLFQCIHETLTDLLPKEVRYLENYDQFKQFINNTLTMPDRMVEKLVLFLKQGKGVLSKRAVTQEFHQLKKNEVRKVENKYKEIFLTDEK